MKLYRSKKMSKESIKCQFYNIGELMAIEEY